MARTLAELTDTELEARFVEAEHNALVWADLEGGAGSTDRGSRWMEIAGELRTELLRRTGMSKPANRRSTRPTSRRRRP